MNQRNNTVVWLKDGVRTRPRKAGNRNRHLQRVYRRRVCASSTVTCNWQLTLVYVELLATKGAIGKRVTRFEVVRAVVKGTQRRTEVCGLEDVADAQRRRAFCFFFSRGRKESSQRVRAQLERLMERLDPVGGVLLS
jgi:hypothetical protein